MGERKVLNKYIPPDFDPSLVPRIKKKKDDLVQVRMMIPFSMQVSIPSRCAALRRVASRCVVLHCVVLHCVPSCPVLSHPGLLPIPYPNLTTHSTKPPTFPLLGAVFLLQFFSVQREKVQLKERGCQRLWGNLFGDTDLAILHKMHSLCPPDNIFDGPRK